MVELHQSAPDKMAFSIRTSRAATFCRGPALLLAIVASSSSMLVLYLLQLPTTGRPPSTTAQALLTSTWKCCTSKKPEEGPLSSSSHSTHHYLGSPSMHSLPVSHYIHVRSQRAHVLLRALVSPSSGSSRGEDRGCARLARQCCRCEASWCSTVRSLSALMGAAQQVSSVAARRLSASVACARRM